MVAFLGFSFLGLVAAATDDGHGRAPRRLGRRTARRPRYGRYARRLGLRARRPLGAFLVPSPPRLLAHDARPRPKRTKGGMVLVDLRSSRSSAPSPRASC